MDARELLAAGPEGYTAARDAEVKRRRAAGDRAGAGELKALGRPALALWAVLAAAADEALARRATEATRAVADAQRAAATGGAAAEVGASTAARRHAVDAVRDRAAALLAEHVGRRRADGQRDEIRDLVDRISRHDDLLGAWLDGTLREVPADTGFDAFADLATVLPFRPRRGAPPRPEPDDELDDPFDGPVDDGAARLAAELAAEREAEALARHRAALAAAGRAVRDAEAELAAAEAELATARRRHDLASAAVTGARSALDELSIADP